MKTERSIYDMCGHDHNGICCFCISDKLSKGKITDEQARQAAEGMSRGELNTSLLNIRRYNDYAKLWRIIKDLLWLT